MVNEKVKISERFESHNEMLCAFPKETPNLWGVARLTHTPNFFRNMPNIYGLILFNMARSSELPCRTR